MNVRPLTLCASAPFVDGPSAVQATEALGIADGRVQRVIEKGAGHRQAG